MGPIGCSETSVTTILRFVTSQKNEDLVYTAARAWNVAGQYLWLEAIWSGGRYGVFIVWWRNRAEIYSVGISKTSEKTFTVGGERDRNSNSPTPEYKPIAWLTNSKEHSPSWKANSSSASQGIPRSLPRSQEPATCLHARSVHSTTSQSIYFRPTLILSIPSTPK